MKLPKVSTINKFEKDLLRCKKRNYNMSLLSKAVSILAHNGSLPEKYKPHKLSGKYADCWECHIKSDWLLVWQQNDDELIKKNPALSCITKHNVLLFINY